MFWETTKNRKSMSKQVLTFSCAITDTKDENSTNFVLDGSDVSIFFKPAITKAFYLKNTFINHQEEELLEKYKKYVISTIEPIKYNIYSALEKRPNINIIANTNINRKILKIFIEALEESLKIKINLT